MPIYEYRCAACGFQKEFLQKMSDAALTDCPECGKAGAFSKMVTAAGFQLKGSGWYVTDFRQGSKPATGTAAKADEYRRVTTSGIFLHDKSALVQASTIRGPGFWLLTPLRRPDGSILFVNRGFVPDRRIERALQRYGDRFLDRIFTPVERARSEGKVTRAASYAKRFAAKEALSKAMGTGFRFPVTLQNMSIVQDRRGKPGFEFHPRLQAMVDDEGIKGHHVTISDEKSLACACVVLEK